MRILIFSYVLSAMALGQGPRLTPVGGTVGGGDPLPVTSAGVTVYFMADVAETILELEFRNPYDRALEAEFVLTLPEGAVVTGYALEINGVMRDAVAVEKQRARTAYESIKRQMIDPGIVEHESGNRYRTRVYPVPANGTKRLRLHYTATLTARDGGFAYTLPLDFAERPDTFTCTLHHSQGQPPDLTKTADLTFEPDPAGGLVAKVNRTDPGSKLPAALLITLPAPGEPELFVDETSRAFFLSVPGVPPAVGVPAPRPDPGNIQLVWDASLAGLDADHKPALELLDQWFSTLRETTVDLHLLRDRLTPAGRFTINGGHWDELKAALAAVHYDGAADLTELRATSAAAVVFVSHGPEALGGSPGPLPIPLFVIRSGDNPVLGHAAYVSGGARIDPATAPADALLESFRRRAARLVSIARLQPDANGVAPKDAREGVVQPWSCPATGHPLQVFGTLPHPNYGQLTLRFSTGEGTDVFSKTVRRSPMTLRDGVVRRLVARHRLATLLQQPSISRDHIIDFCQAHGLAGEFTSLIVLERMEDYVRYRIPPPGPDLLADYQRLIRKDEPIDRLRAAWSGRLAWFKRSYPGVDAVLFDRLRQVDIWRKAMESQFAPQQRPPESFAVITGWLEETRRHIVLRPSGKKCDEFFAWKDIVDELAARGSKLSETPIPPVPAGQDIAVSVRGLVNSPGVVTAKPGLTLRQAITLAGGVSPVGSLDCVALYRNAGKTVYNTLSRSYQEQVLQPGDMIVVMQPYGPGDSAGMDPFAEASETRDPPPADQPAVRLSRDVWTDRSPWSSGAAAIPSSAAQTRPIPARSAATPAPDFAAFDQALAAGRPAESAYRDLTHNGRLNPRDYLEAARRLFAAKQPALGRRVLSNLVAVRPQDHAALFTYAVWLAEFGLTDDAARQLSDLTENNPDNCEFPLVLASVCGAAGDAAGVSAALRTVPSRLSARSEPNLAAIALTELNACGWEGPGCPTPPPGWRDQGLLRNLPIDLRITVTSAEGKLPLFVVREPVGTTAAPDAEPTLCGGMIEAGGMLAAYSIREAIPGNYQLLCAVDRPTTVRIAIHTRWGSPDQRTRILTRWLEPAGVVTLAEISDDPDS